ncbi:MAG: hypothetical protein A2073_00320 [Deltaproteobacteria bacterium GWC2_42_11]|nr:MAG: hypothetical protein A2073_00320 [Deltaproteobacteria bacterium GWC2_42_11]
MKIRIDIGYKFIFGFIAVVAATAFAPFIIDRFDMPEWLRVTVTFLAAIVIGLIFGSFFTRGFSRDFQNLTSIADEISRGDLTHPGRIHLKKIFMDEISDLAEALEMMHRNLKTLVGQIHESASSLSESSEGLHAVVNTGRQSVVDLGSSTSRIFAGTVEQAEHLDKTTGIVKDMSQSAEEVAASARDASLSASRANNIVQEGALLSSFVIEKMEAVFQRIEESKNMMLALSDRMNNIPKILDVITHISRQIDLLALNATIEASRAGEHGRGFAMVAEEVRRLAERTNKSIVEVDLIVKDVKEESGKVVTAFIEGTSFVSEGRSDTHKIKDFLKDINIFTNEVTGKIDLILKLTQRQSESAVNAAHAIEAVANVARDNVSATKEADAVMDNHRKSLDEVFVSAEKLSELSRKLKEMVDGFKVLKSYEPIIDLPEAGYVQLSAGEANDKLWR